MKRELLATAKAHMGGLRDIAGWANSILAGYQDNAENAARTLAKLIDRIQHPVAIANLEKFRAELATPETIQLFWVIQNTDGQQVTPDYNDDGSYHLGLRGTRYHTADAAYSELCQLVSQEDDYLHIARDHAVV